VCVCIYIMYIYIMIRREYLGVIIIFMYYKDRQKKNNALQ
jgi:hypothetical protein